MNQTEVEQIAVAILESNSNSETQKISLCHLNLVIETLGELLQNGHIDNEHLDELKRVHQMIQSNNYVDWLHNIEHLTLWSDKSIQWKGVTIDLYTSHNEDKIRELHSRCLYIESIGLIPNKRNCTDYWNEYKDLDPCIIGYAYPWAVDYYYEGKGKWCEINEEAYNWYLGCVFPTKMSSNGFLCGEPYTHQNDGFAVYLGCREEGTKYYAKMMTGREYHSKMNEPINDRRKGLNTLIDA
jgi:hypothetical protein